MRLATPPFRFSILCLSGMLFVGALFAGPLFAQEETLSPEEKREQIAADRFLQLLLRRPTTGTALDRVFGHHVARGNLGELLADLEKVAGQKKKAGDEKSAGNHWMVIGLLQLQRGEEAAAAQALKKAEAVLTDNPLTAYHHGQALLLLGKNDDAAQAMQRAIELKPPRRDFLNIATQLGSLYQRAGKADDAVKIWKQLEDSFPGDDSVRQRIARVLADEGDLTNALKRYDDLAKTARSPNDRIVFALRASDLRMRLGQKGQATKNLEMLLARLRPGSYLYAEARRRIENAFLESGDYAGLTEYYEKWLKDHPDDAGAILRLARTLSIQGRGPESLKWLEKAIERSPSERVPRLALIDTYIAEERYGDAAAQYEKLAEMEPKNPDHLVRWGQVVLEDPKKPKEQRKAAAAAIWGRLAEARPDDAVIQSQVADLFRGAELKDEAIAGYRKAVTLAPNEPQYKEYLGEYLHRLDRHKEALPVWRSIAEGKLRTRENLVRLAEVLHQFDEPKEALKTLAEACEMNPTITERIRYAEWLRDEKAFEKALEQLRLADDQTDTVDDREKIFAEEVKTYQAAGELENQIAEARKKAEAEKSNGELWRRLAILCDANNQSRESLKAIENALKHSGDSIETLDVASRMYEKAGRLQEAIKKRQLLANTDRRFRSGHLQRLASLYMRTGQAENAIATGKLLLAGGGGSIESFKFYADLCGQLGRIDERLDTYRRCVRINPRNSDAQELLASQLAEDFKTDQAIELYWNMLDSSTELEDRRRVVQSLTDLYLRSNRLDQLISRLEIRGRESGDRRGTIDLIATAYEQAGDLGLAREALEGLLREQGRDTLLLDRLIALAEKSGEAEEAVELQRQLLRLSPGRQNEAKLAKLLIDIGAMNEAEVLWTRLSEQSSDRGQTSRNLNRLFAAGETEMAIRLATKVLEKDPNDWESLLQLMLLQAAEKHWEQATKTAERFRSLKIEDTALPTGGKPYQSTITRNGQTYTQPPLKFMRTQQLYDMSRLLDDRYGYRPRTSLPKPLDFGHAKLMASYVVFQSDQGRIQSDLKELAEKANAETATPDDVWTWFNSVAIVQRIDSTLAPTFQRPETWAPYWKLAEVDSKAGSTALISMLYNRWSVSLRNNDSTLAPLDEDKLKWLKEKASETDSSDPATNWYGNASWELIYDSEMRIAGQGENADDLVKEYISKAIRERDMKLAVSLLTMVLNQGDDDHLWSLIELFRNNPQDPTLKRRYGSSSNLDAYYLGMFASKNRIDQELSKGPEDALYRQRVMTLLESMLAAEAAKPVRRSTIRLTSVGQSRQTYVQRGSTYESIVITFPAKGIGPEDQFINSLWTLNELHKDSFPNWTKDLETSKADEDPRLKVLRNVVAGTLLEWNEQTGQAIQKLSNAVSIAEKEVPHAESELRLMWVDLLLRQGQKREALEVMDRLTVYDQNTMAVREFAAAKLAAALDDKERARAAAKRLFGVRLDTNTQIELAKLMRSLGMYELASDLVRRMRSRGGNNVEQLNTLMTYFASQGDKDQAAEVAVELLRRSVPTRRQSSSYTTATQARRRSALQTLANVGRLTSLIETTEKRLERSPKSQRIRGELAEMYVSAGQTAKAQKLLADSVTGDTQSLIALEQAAKQLVTAGKMDEACETYLKVLRRKPELLRNEYYEVKRPFERTKRLGDLADLIIKVGVHRFESYRVADLCEDLGRDTKQGKKFRALYLAILDAPSSSSNSLYGLNSIINSRTPVAQDEELFSKTVDYMIQASQKSSGNWDRLFSGYSTSSDGRHRNAAMNLVEALSDHEKHAQLLEDRLRKDLKENDKWHEGRAWLGTLLVARKQYEEAKKHLEPLMDKDAKPAPSYTVFWLIGSLIDKHEPMQELALKMYQHSIDKHGSEIYQRGSEFKYSLANRGCQLMKDMGKNAEARNLLLTSLGQREKMQRVIGNDDYEAYRQAQERIEIMKFLGDVNYPADGLRFARTFDTSLFEKAARYSERLQSQFDQQQEELLNQVRKQGGLGVVESLIDAETPGPRAVDLGITAGERPFTENGIQSLWIEMFEQAVNNPKLADKRKALIERLNNLKAKRPQDDSVALAYAVASDMEKNPKPLRALIEVWKTNTEEQEIGNPLYRRQALILAILHVGRSQGKEDRQFVDRFVAENLPDWTWEHRMLLLAELGRQALKENDTARAGQLWQRLLTGSQSQLILLDLAHAAAESKLPMLSYQAATVAATAPEKRLTTTTTAPAKTNSLSTLLNTGNQQSSTSSSNQDQPDPAAVRFAQRVLELDDAWRANKVAPQKVCESLMAIVFGDSTLDINAYCTPVVIRPNNLLIDSVFDRLAKRARWTKLTDQVLARMANDDTTSHLLSALALFRNLQSEEAAKRYAQVDPVGLKSLPKETVLQALLPALQDANCQGEVLRIGVAFVEQNKPTQRYQDVDPFDSLALKLAQVAIRNNHTELGMAAINNYLEISQHQNDRYSSGTYGLSRRIEQLNKVSRLLASKGLIEKALDFAGLRQSLFEMGIDSGNDVVGALILRRIENLKDRKRAYRVLTDWTFAGDGPLRRLAGLVHQQPLPNWIPESEGGKYPQFSPRASEAFPTVSNWYALAKLAIETDQMEDLLKRLHEAHKNQRSGSPVALGIALAVAEQPIPQELLGEIDKHMDEINPEENDSSKPAVPLPGMQLATILAQKTEHAEWARNFAIQFERHGNLSGRSYIMRWLNRYRYEQGWLPDSKLTPAVGLQHWLPSSAASAANYASGFPSPIWLTDGKSQLNHIGGIGEDSNWFRYPLEGDFEFQLEISDGGWRESYVLANGLRFSPNGAGKRVDVASKASRDWVRFPTSTIEKGKWNRHTFRFEGETVTYLLNDTPIYEEPRRIGATWIALQSPGMHLTRVRNVRFAGKPQMAREMDLLHDEGLRDWSGLYYSQPLPTANISLKTREPKATDGRSYRTAPKPNQLAQLAWAVKSGELISGKTKGQGKFGPMNQSVIRYDRPLGQGETLSYEFFYEAGKTAVHPALGRTAYMLHPEGLNRHWMTAVGGRWKLPKDNEVPLNAESPVKLPLKEGEWNQVMLHLGKNHHFQIRLNEELVFDQQIEILPQGAIFGLFHYADRTTARVRNIKLTGPWPQAMPEKLFSTSE